GFPMSGCHGIFPATLRRCTEWVLIPSLFATSFSDMILSMLTSSTPGVHRNNELCLHSWLPPQLNDLQPNHFGFVRDLREPLPQDLPDFFRIDPFLNHE